MKITVTWGQDTPAYATQTVEIPDGKSTEEIVGMVKAMANDVGNLVFTPANDWTGLRIVAIDKISESGAEDIAGDIPIEVSPADLGLITMGALSGDYRLSKILVETDRQQIAVNTNVEAAVMFAEKAFALDGTSKAQVVIPGFRPFQLVLSAYALSDYGDGPAFAEIQMSPEALHEFVKMGAAARACGIHTAHFDEDDAIWSDPDECLLMRNTKMVVFSGESFKDHEFYYEGRPKHANFKTETRALSFGKLLDAIAAKSDEDLPKGFARRDGVMFYDEGVGELDHLIDFYFSKPWSDIHPGDEVYWMDPDNGISSGYYRVQDVLSGDVILIRNDAGSSAEVFLSELYDMPPEDYFPVVLDGEVVGHATQESAAEVIFSRGQDTGGLKDGFQVAPVSLVELDNIGKAWCAADEVASLKKAAD